MQWVLGIVIVLSATRLLAQVMCKTHVLSRYPVLSAATSPSLAAALLALYLYNKES